MIETYRGVVYPNQMDHMDHMNVQWYTAKFDEATWHLFSAVGITSAYIRQHRRGMAALEQTTKYQSEVSAGELLVIRSRVLEVGDKTLHFFSCNGQRRNARACGNIGAFGRAPGPGEAQKLPTAKRNQGLLSILDHVGII